MNPQNEDSQKIDEYIRNKAELDTILLDPDFLLAWETLSPTLLEYLIENIQIILDNALQIADPYNPLLTVVCIQIFKFKKQIFIDNLLKNKKFLNTFTQFPLHLEKYNLATIKSYFDLLSFISVNSRLKFYVVIPTERYLISIIKCIYLEASFRFFNAMLSSKFAGVPQLINHSNLVQHLVDEYFLRTRNSLQSKAILVSCLKNEFVYNTTINVIMNNNNINRLIDDAFVQRNYHSVDFLMDLYNQSIKMVNELEINEVKSQIDQCFSTAGEILAKTNIFGGFEKYMSDFFLLLLGNQTYIGNQAIDAILRSFDLFFQYKTNSFIHNFVLNIVRIISKNDQMFCDIIKMSQIIPRIIIQYTQRNTTEAIYWGQLHKICQIIDPYVDLAQYPEWGQVVQKECQLKQNIIDGNEPFFPDVVRKKVDPLYRSFKRMNIIFKLMLILLVLLLIVLFTYRNVSK